VKIAVFGLGYVGSVSAVCLAAAGHDVIGVEVEPQKLSLVQSGHAPVTEPNLEEGLGAAIASGRFRATADTTEAVAASDVALVCVGTPSRRNGSLDSTYLERVMEQVGAALADRSSYYVVAIRSTVLPGVVSSKLIPLLERASGRSVGTDLGVCVNPEFLREGTAIDDFQSPPFTLIGESDAAAGDALLQAYAPLRAPVHRMRFDEASMVKYASNAFHALKVAFANEIGALSHELAIDGRAVMQVFCEDRDLNISAKYLRPGFAFGGSCLPKDLRALNYVAKDLDVATPLLSNALASNAAHVQRVVDAVLESGARRVALLGLSFKNGSDDLRESPFVDVAEALIGKGLTMTVWDPDVALGQLVGRNRSYISQRLPHIAQLMTPDWRGQVADADAIIIAKNLPVLDALPEAIPTGRFVIDLVGVNGLPWARRPWSGFTAAVPSSFALSADVRQG
jgi:GDP-mannose 6-dehydrogenase